VTDPALRLAPRSAVAIADLELLRFARTDLDQPETSGGPSLADRLRSLATFRPGPVEPDGVGPMIRLGRFED
jgi:hypothetical protein